MSFPTAISTSNCKKQEILNRAAETKNCSRKIGIWIVVKFLGTGIIYESFINIYRNLRSFLTRWHSLNCLSRPFIFLQTNAQKLSAAAVSSSRLTTNNGIFKKLVSSAQPFILTHSLTIANPHDVERATSTVDDKAADPGLFIADDEKVQLTEDTNSTKRSYSPSVRTACSMGIEARIGRHLPFIGNAYPSDILEK